MKQHSKHRRLALAAGMAAAVLTIVQAPHARADVDAQDSLIVPLPIAIEESFYVEVLDASANTPTLSSGSLELTYSIVGDAGDLVIENEFTCPAERPDPIARVVLTAAQGSLSASASITGTTTDTQTGAEESFEATVPDPPAAATLATSDTQILRVCGEAEAEDQPNASPTANFESSCSSLSCGFEALASDPDGRIVAWAWQFGDGSSAEVEVPTHTYAAGGTYPVTLTVTDDRGASTSTTESITVYEPLRITTAGLPDAKKKTAYSATLQASGGSAPYSWKVTAGSLPSGLLLGADGALSGTPKNPGSFSFTVEATDTRGDIATEALILKVASH